MPSHLISQSFDVRYTYSVGFTRGAFEPANTLLRDVLCPGGEQRVRVLMVLDEGVATAQPERAALMAQYAQAHADAIELVRAPWIVRGGEVVKSDPREVHEFYEHARELGLCRHSYVVALGGGAMLDAIGYAAATAHRGIRLVRMPSTVLGQNDAGIGVKNAINWHGRKNFLGTFVPPFAVINDFDLLSSASAADQHAGIAEAVKVSLIRDRSYFDWLYRQRHALAALERSAMEDMIIRCAELHLAQIRNCGDPFERGSARPLDFGHWSAHKLEELSRSALRHGEAVAIGVALDTLYSRRIGMIGDNAVNAVLTTLHDIGFTLYHSAFEQLDIACALNDFREHLGGDLCITLLSDIGVGVEVNSINVAAMRACVDELHSLQARQ